jgi:hypothetical protein
VNSAALSDKGRDGELWCSSYLCVCVCVCVCSYSFLIFSYCFVFSSLDRDFINLTLVRAKPSGGNLEFLFVIYVFTYLLVALWFGVRALLLLGKHYTTRTTPLVLKFAILKLHD